MVKHYPKLKRYNFDRHGTELKTSFEQIAVREITAYLITDYCRHHHGTIDVHTVDTRPYAKYFIDL